MRVLCAESTYEFDLKYWRTSEAFGPGCWRWWGAANIPAGSWTHVGTGVDGTNEKHFVNGVFVEQDGCAGSLTINDDDFMIGARGVMVLTARSSAVLWTRPRCSAACCPTMKWQLSTPISLAAVAEPWQRLTRLAGRLLAT